MKLKDCKFDGHGKFDIDDFPTSAHADKTQRAKYEELTAANIKKMAALQDRLYAEGDEGIVIMFQAMDAAGKDSTIKHVMSGVNPQGVNVYSFKQPSKEELAHDFLWRAVRNLPERGQISIFNRSYYEDVLVVRVHEIQKSYSMPERCIDMDEESFFKLRYRQIADFERYLYENGYRFLKVFLNVGKDEQKKRFLERIDNPEKNWKFSAGDLDERDLWSEYMKAFEGAINATSTKECPWYIIPADQKWFARWLISEAVVNTLEDCDPQYPELQKEEVEALGACKARLTGE